MNLLDSKEAKLVWKRYQKKIKNKKTHFIKTPYRINQSFKYPHLDNVILTKRTKKKIGKQGKDYYEDEGGNIYLYCYLCEKIKQMNSDNFYKQHTLKLGYRVPCKNCEKLIQKYKRDINPELRARMAEDAKQWAKNNKERYNETQRVSRKKRMEDPEYRKNSNEYMAIYRSENPDKIKKIQKDHDQRVRECPLRSNSKKLRSSFSCFVDKICNLEDKDILSTEKVFEIFGYTIQEFKAHIEKQFHSGMNWENQGTIWHIDHIIPLARLATDDPNSERAKFAWNLSNLRPMLAQDNLNKSSLYEGKRWTYKEGFKTPFKLPGEDRYI